MYTLSLQGSLDAPVAGYPPFPGNEAAFLRAVVALIAADTTVSPQGLYAVADPDEDEFAIALADGEEMEIVEDVSTLGAWTHHTLTINSEGRALPSPPEMDEEGEPIEREDAPEPPVPLMPLEEEESSWALRVCPAGDVVAIRSLKWPGAVVVGAGGPAHKFVNVYVGYGQAWAEATYTPPPPPPLAVEFPEVEMEFKEAADVTEDPDAGKEEEEEEEED
jgi:radial spoke head protein 4/6